MTLGLGAHLGCTERVQSPPTVGEEYAAHLCPIQTECECSVALANCEDTVVGLIDERVQEAVADGLTFDRGCMDEFLSNVDTLGDCNVLDVEQWQSCPVYHKHASEGDPCVTYSVVPRMNDCAPGLQCIEGVCEDRTSPPVLNEGDECSTRPELFPVGVFGECGPTLRCDLSVTLTCVQAIAPGEVCNGLDVCEPDYYCRTSNPADLPSEEAPGTCQPRSTPEGEPCVYPGECTTLCTPEGTCFQHPPALCNLLSSIDSLTRESD